MKIATFNINNVNKRLDNLLVWLEEAKLDVACLQELKCTGAAFPIEAIRKAGYHAAWCGEKSWNGVAILARGKEPVLIRNPLPGNAKDKQSRYIEAAVDGVVVASIYLPNGNPQPGPKFDYKLKWFDRLLDHAAELLSLEVPVVLAGDYNVVPTDFDLYATRSYRDNALLQPAPRAAYAKLVASGWTDALRTLHPEEPMFTFWSYLRSAWPRDAGLRLDHLLLSPVIAQQLEAAGLILSMVAALQAPVILMSQNRQAARDRLVAGLDYEINLKAEIEIMSLHDKLDKMRIGKLERMLET